MNPEYDKGYQSGYDAGYKRAMLDYGLEDDKPCGDCVSREAVMQIVNCCVSSKDAVNSIRHLPSVTPERPSVDDICKILSDVLDTPCNYGLDTEEVSDIIPSEWCEDNCPANEDYSMCWKKYFEIKSADMRGTQE